MRISLKNLLSPSMILLGFAIVIEAAGLIIYSQTGIDEFSSVLSTSVLAFPAVACGLGVLLLFLRLFNLDRFLRGLTDLIPFVAYLIALLGFIYYVGSQANYLANVFVSIDGNSISSVFVLTVGFFLLGFVAFLVSGILLGRKMKKQEGGQEHEVRNS